MFPCALMRSGPSVTLDTPKVDKKWSQTGLGTFADQLTNFGLGQAHGWDQPTMARLKVAW